MAVEAILRERFFGRGDLTPDEAATFDASTLEDEAAADKACRTMPEAALQLTWLSELYALRDRYRPDDGSVPNSLVVAGMTAGDRVRYRQLEALVFGRRDN